MLPKEYISYICKAYDLYPFWRKKWLFKYNLDEIHASKG
jgi:hypothetical protein